MKYYLIFLGIMSIISLIIYGVDKLKAKHHKWRIPESALLSFGFFGGSVGALAGMKLFRHKTKHIYFWIVNILGLAWQAALLIFLIMRD
ncbi:MAG: DUF1294 domain-containing protein [Oscillospiraceae bacterium]|nr:DUF1294 domain-containing protein [Oscillospiraceae bacterium]